MIRHVLRGYLVEVLFYVSLKLIQKLCRGGRWEDCSLKLRGIRGFGAGGPKLCILKPLITKLVVVSSSMELVVGF